MSQEIKPPSPRKFKATVHVNFSSYLRITVNILQDTNTGVRAQEFVNAILEFFELDDLHERSDRLFKAWIDNRDLTEMASPGFRFKTAGGPFPSTRVDIHVLNPLYHSTSASFWVSTEYCKGAWDTTVHTTTDACDLAEKIRAIRNDM